MATAAARACFCLFWGSLACLTQYPTSGSAAAFPQVSLLGAFFLGAEHQQKAGCLEVEDPCCARRLFLPPEAAPSHTPWFFLRLRGGRGGKARQAKAAKGGGKPMKGDTLRSMAPSINREEEENGGGGGLKGGRILKQRGKWANPHIPNRRLSIRQGRVQRANRDVQASCKAAVRLRSHQHIPAAPSHRPAPSTYIKLRTFPHAEAAHSN